MSDAGRKNVADKIGSKITPDSQKSLFEQGKDKVTDSIDTAVGNNTSDNDKSLFQQASDKIFGDK